MTLKSLLIATTALVGLTSLTTPGQAAGVAASTAVTNTIDVSYDSDGTPITLPSAASDSFVVDEKIGFTFTGEDSPSTVTVNPAQPEAVLIFALTNTGNDSRGFDVDMTVTDAGNPLGLVYDPTGAGAPGTYSVYVSANPTGGPDTLYEPSGISNLGPLAPDETRYVKIVAHVGDAAIQGEEDIFILSARALNTAGTAPATESTTFDAASTETVFGDAGADGIETSQEEFLVSSALIMATKSVTIASENRDGTFNCAFDADQGGEAFIPGSCVNYTITLSNDAAAGEVASNFSFTDTLPANLTFHAIVPGHTFDSVVVGTGTVTGSVTSMAPGESATLTFRAEIE